MTTRRVFLGSMAAAGAYPLIKPSPNTPTKVSASASVSPAVFFVAHQDDETLQMGLDIIRHASSGREVYVILYSDGTGSGAHPVINGTVGSGISSWWGLAHNTLAEGYLPLSDAEFSAARVKEFKSACGQLTIPPARVIYDPISNDDLTAANLEILIQKYVTMFGASASYKAHTYHDTHPHHAASGQALLNLYNDGAVTDARFYVSRGDIQQGAAFGGKTAVASSIEALRVKHAVDCYYAWNPSCGSYAIGAHSVHPQFQHLLANNYNRYHVPNV